jgi:hypothetical protein
MIRTGDAFWDGTAARRRPPSAAEVGIGRREIKAISPRRKLQPEGTRPKTEKQPHAK